MHSTPSTHSTSPTKSTSTLDQREQAAAAHERALEREAAQLTEQHGAVVEQTEQLARRQPAGAALQVPPLTLEPVLGALRLVREDALRQRAEAAGLLEARMRTLRAGLEAVGAELTARTEERAQAELRARAERSRAEGEAAALVAQLRATPSRPEPRGDSLAATLLSAAVPTVGDPANRRTARRVDMVAAVTLHSDTNFFSGFSSDVSTGGLFIATLQPAPIGTEVSLCFTVPGGTEISAVGEVRWVRDLSPLQPELFPGVGVAFTDIAPESVAAISRFIAEREPMFLPEP